MTKIFCIGKGSKNCTTLPPTSCTSLRLHPVEPSATPPPASPGPAGIAPEKDKKEEHTHVCFALNLRCILSLIRAMNSFVRVCDGGRKRTCRRRSCSSCHFSWRRRSPSWSHDQLDEEGLRDGTCSWRSTDRLEHHHSAQTFNTNTHTTYVWTCSNISFDEVAQWLTSDIADSEPPARENNTSAKRTHNIIRHASHKGWGIIRRAFLIMHRVTRDDRFMYNVL